MGAFKDIIEDKDVTPDTSKSTDTVKSKREATAILVLKKLMKEKADPEDPNTMSDVARMMRQRIQKS